MAALLFVSSSASAFTFDTNLFYLSDSFTVTTADKYTKRLIDAAVTINLDKKGQFVIGWNFSSYSLGDTVNGVATSFTSTEMGPKLGWYFDKSYLWSLFFAYNLKSTAKYDDGVTQEVEWRGTTIKGELGYTPQITDSLYGGLKLNYYKASFNEQLTGTTNYAVVSISRGIIYPSISFVYRFN